jgi:hypothetical protein
MCASRKSRLLSGLAFLNQRLLNFGKRFPQISHQVGVSAKKKQGYLSS